MHGLAPCATVALMSDPQPAPIVDGWDPDPDISGTFAEQRGAEPMKPVPTTEGDDA